MSQPIKVDLGCFLELCQYYETQEIQNSIEDDFNIF
jgi:hypothetical protein